MNRIQDFHKQLEDANIPIHGVSLTGPAPGGVKIFFKPEATGADRTQAATLLAAFDFAPRRMIPFNNFYVLWQTLTLAQKDRLLCYLIWTRAKNDVELRTRLTAHFTPDEPDI